MVEGTYLMLKGQIGENVINRLEEVSGGYSFENMGLSRLNVLLVNPVNGIELSGDPLRFMRKHIIDNIRIGDLDCAIEIASTLLERRFGIPMRNVEDLYYLVDSRFLNEEQYMPEGKEEFYRQVFKRNEAQVTMGIANSIKPKVAKRLGLSPFTYRKYMHRKSNLSDFNGLSRDEVRVAYLSGEQLNYITGEDISQTGIHSISFKVKSLPSIVGKNMRVFRKIYVPTQEEIDKITGKRGEKLRAEEIWEFYEDWLDYVLKRNEDIFKTVISDKHVPSVLARKRFPGKRDKFNAKELNERFLDTFLIDNSGVAFVTDSIQNLEGLIRRFDGVIPNYQILPYKSESFSGKKDNATVRVVLRDRNPANAAEFRGQLLGDNARSHFGSHRLKSSSVYKMECRRASIEALKGNGRKSNKEGWKKFKETFRRSLEVYNVTQQQVGIHK